MDTRLCERCGTTVGDTTRGPVPFVMLDINLEPDFTTTVATFCIDCARVVAPWTVER